MSGKPVQIDLSQGAHCIGVTWIFGYRLLEQLDRAIGSTRARLKLRPEQVVSATRQALAGQVIPMEELRNELRARVRT